MRLEKKRYQKIAWLQVFVLASVVGLWSNPTRADVIDDHVAQGNTAARAGDWSAAIEAYAEAERLLPGRSAVLSYNLGTAYAQQDQLGLATYHLRRALAADSDASTEVAESASRNLGIVRQRAELAAASNERRLSAAEGWGDVVRALLVSPVVATFAVALSWAFLVALIGRAWLRRRGRDVIGATAIVIGTAVLAALLGVGHAWSARIDEDTPLAIVVADAAEVRSTAGSHGSVAFVAQGGSQVRLIGSAPGWTQIRLSGGLAGWVPQASVRALAGQ